MVKVNYVFFHNFATFLPPTKHSPWWRRLGDVLKTSWSRPIYSSWPYVSKTSSRRFQDIFKTSSKRLQDVWQKRLQEILKTSWKYLEDVLQKCLQDVFEAYHQVNLFLLKRLREVFNTFLRRSSPKTVMYRGICLGNTTSEKFMVSVQNLQEISFSFSLYYTFPWLLTEGYLEPGRTSTVAFFCGNT